MSVESGLAETLGLKLGDSLRFDIAGQFTEARITSLRKVDWGSMRVNFFVLFPNAQLDNVPSTYIAAFKAPPAREGPGGDRQFDNALIREFPNLTNIDVSASIAQVQGVLDQVIRAVEFLFVFTLAAGLVVLFAAVTATREARSREFAVMRALGASGTLLAQVQRAELLGIGALAGMLASVAAGGIGWRWPIRLRLQLESIAVGADPGRSCRGTVVAVGGLVGTARRPAPAGGGDAATSSQLKLLRASTQSRPPASAVCG